MKYVYLHINETGVFYVGCGNRKRPQYQHRSALWKRVAASGYSIWIVGEFDQQDAWELEKELISHFQPSCNKSTGGYGYTGCAHTPETRKKVSGENHLHHKLTEIQVLAIREDTRTRRIIAVDYGVSVAQLSKIKSRKSWSHVA